MWLVAQEDNTLVGWNGSTGQADGRRENLLTRNIYRLFKHENPHVFTRQPASPLRIIGASRLLCGMEDPWDGRGVRWNSRVMRDRALNKGKWGCSCSPAGPDNVVNFSCTLGTLPRTGITVIYSSLAPFTMRTRRPLLSGALWNYKRNSAQTE